MKRSETKQNSGIALVFGVGALGQHYGARTVTLQSPENDAKDFEIIAKLNGLEAKVFLHSNATRQCFQTNIAKAAKALGAGDFLLLVFSGFGGCVPNFPSKSSDRPTNTWCLHDGQVLYTEIKSALSSFQDGVNVLVIADCSSSQENSFGTSEQKTTTKSLTKEIADTVYLANKDFYDAVSLATISHPAIHANIVWLHACQPNQTSHENAFNGLLTSAIKHQWKGGMFHGVYQQFIEEVTMVMPPFQSPSLEVLGGNPSAILQKRPFSI